MAAFAYLRRPAILHKPNTYQPRFDSMKNPICLQAACARLPRGASVPGRRWDALGGIVFASSSSRWMASMLTDRSGGMTMAGTTVCARTRSVLVTVSPYRVWWRPGPSALPHGTSRPVFAPAPLSSRRRGHPRQVIDILGTADPAVPCCPESVLLVWTGQVAAKQRRSRHALHSKGK